MKKTVKTAVKKPTSGGTGPLTENLVTALVSGKDRPGIIFRVAQFIFKNGGNVIDQSQFTDPNDAAFFMRTVFDVSAFKLSREDMERGIAETCGEIGLSVQLFFPVRKRVAILVTRDEHCIRDILFHKQIGEFEMDIPAIISNHADLKYIADRENIPFRLFPNAPETAGPDEKRTWNEERNDRIHDTLAGLQVDLVVLAKYMQIVTGKFLTGFPNRIVNIHHGDPGFSGADPYGQAFERGVKTIGAMAHFVTAELDAGPILVQRQASVTHKHTREDFRRIGRENERLALIEAIRLCLENRVIVHNNRTILFD
jgi:formyltetrahydrofolate deformylase